MTSTTLDNHSLLAPIEATLRRLIWRARAAIVVRGLLATLLAAGAGILLAMGVGAQWMLFESWQHYGLTLMWLSMAAAAAVLTLLRPLLHTFTLTGIARLLESRHPELQERISSAVQLLRSGEAPELRGSEALIRALADQAGCDARALVPRREITFRRARPFLLALGVVAAVIAGLYVAWPRSVGRLFKKTLAPYLNLPNLRADDLVITPGDRTLPEGQRLEVTARVGGVKLSKAEFRGGQPGGADKPAAMSPLPEGGFGFVTPPLRDSFRYRIRAGDALSRYYDIRVVARPAVARIDVGYQYPAYTALPAVPPAPAPGPIAAVVGTVATVRLHLSKPVSRAELFVGNAPAALEQTGSLTLGFEHRLTASPVNSWRLMLTDEYGQPGAPDHLVVVGEPVEHEIRAAADAPPTVVITRPGEGKLRLKPADHLPIQYTLSDDFGVARAELLVSIDGRAQPPIEAPRDGEGSVGEAGAVKAVASARTMLKLGELDLSGARKVSFRIRALDGLPQAAGGPQEGLSAERTIDLDVKAPDYVMQVQTAMDIRVREALERIYKELQAAKKLSEPLRRSMPQTVQLSVETLSKIDEERKHLALAEDQTRRLADMTAGTAYPRLSETLGRLAEQHIGKSRELADLLKITDQQKQRAELADEADFQIDRTLQIVSDLLKKFDVMTEQARKAAVFEDLAERQQELAAAKAAASQPTTVAASRPANSDQAQAKLDDAQWRKAQRDVARDLGQLVRQTPQALAEALKPDRKQSADLAEQADRLQRQQAALMQNTQAAQRVSELDQAMRQAAAEQAELARQAQQLAARAAALQPASAPARQAAEQAAAAAQALAATQPATAAKAQERTIRELEQTQQQAAAEQLRQIAQAARAQSGEDNAAAQAQPAAQQAQRQALAGEVAKTAGDLAQKQRALQQKTAGLSGELAQRATELARQQERVAQQAAALAEHQPDRPLAERQAEIADQTREVRDDAKLIAEHVENFGDPAAQQLAQSASTALQQAQAAQRAAQQAMAVGQPGQSIPSQTVSQTALASAAQAMRALGQRMSTMAQQPATAPSPALPGDVTPAQMAEAMQSVQGSADSGAPGDAARAAQMLSQMAQQANPGQGEGQMAQGQPGQLAPGAPQGTPQAQPIHESQARVGQGQTDLTAAELQKLGLSADEWMRLPGHLRDQVLQAANQGGPEEYRVLIKRYFQAIARKGAVAGTDKP